MVAGSVSGPTGLKAPCCSADVNAGTDGIEELSLFWAKTGMAVPLKAKARATEPKNLARQLILSLNHWRETVKRHLSNIRIVNWTMPVSRQILVCETSRRTMRTGNFVRSHADRRFVKAQFLEFAIKCRPSNAELARDLGHLPTVVADGEFQHICFQ